MEIGMLNFWLGLLVTALMEETYFNSYILSDKNKTEQQRKTFKSTVDALKDEKKMKYLLLLWPL